MSSYGANYFIQRANTRNCLAYENDISFLSSFANRGDEVLDYGCGEMYFSEFLKAEGLEVSVYDPSSEIQERTEYGTTYREIDFDSTYDIVVLRGVLQHLETPFYTLGKEIKNLVRVGGHLVFLATPNIDSPYYRINRTLPFLVPELNFWNPSFFELKRVMCNYGFKYTYSDFPYLRSGYARPVRDHLKYILNIIGINAKYPFWGSMMNVAFQRLI